MKKIEIELPSATILHIAAGKVECVEAEGTIYVPLIKGTSVGTGSNPVSIQTSKPAATVVDDTKPTAAKTTPAPAASKAAPAKPKPAVKAPENDNPELIEDWSTLVPGQNVLVELNIPEYAGKKWSAEIISNEGDVVTVKFHEDGESDNLRAGDKVFNFSVV